MRTTIASIGMFLGLAAAAWAQSAPKPAPWAGYNQGVHWEASLDEAKKKAERTGRPILLYQLVGDLKAEGC